MRRYMSIMLLVSVLAGCGGPVTDANGASGPAKLVGTWVGDTSDDTRISMLIRDDGTFGMKAGDLDCTGTAKEAAGKIRLDVDCGVLKTTGDGVLSDADRKLAVTWAGHFGQVAFKKLESDYGKIKPGDCLDTDDQVVSCTSSEADKKVFKVVPDVSEAEAKNQDCGEAAPYWLGESGKRGLLICELAV